MAFINWKRRHVFDLYEYFRFDKIYILKRVYSSRRPTDDGLNVRAGSRFFFLFSLFFYFFFSSHFVISRVTLFLFVCLPDACCCGDDSKNYSQPPLNSVI